MDVVQLKELIFEHGKDAGFTDMEVYYQSNSEFSCRVFKGEVDDYSMSQEGGISFRGVYRSYCKQHLVVN
jgi:PmbA protein